MRSSGGSAMHSGLGATIIRWKYCTAFRILTSSSDVQRHCGCQYIRGGTNENNHANNRFQQCTNNQISTHTCTMFKPCQIFFQHSVLVVALLILSATPAPVRRSIDNDYNLRLVNQSRNLSEIESPIYNTTINVQNPNGNLSQVLNDLCDLLSFYDMLGALNETNGDNLHKVLTVIIVDACKWIVSTTDSSSGEESCDSPDLLRKQCVGERSKASGWLNNTFFHYKKHVHDYGKPVESTQ